MSDIPFRPTTEQQDIIRHEGAAFVTACPGAGKTRVMAERAHLLFQSVPLGQGVAFLSFTRAAVSELEARLRQHGNLPSPLFPSFIGTFDSFVWHFFIAPCGLKGCDMHPSLVPDMPECEVTPYKGAHPLPLSCFDVSSGAIDGQAAKRKGFDISEKQAQIPAYETAARNMRARFRERGQLSYEDARVTALDRLNDTALASRLAAALASRFCEVIVDEAQDCNPDDLAIISWLRRAGPSVKVICDPHQSIYEFRGGVTDHLFDFADTYADHERMNLTGNFRSSLNICKAIAQLRPPDSRDLPDKPIGPNKDERSAVYVLSYAGTAVPSSIGVRFSELVRQVDEDISTTPVLAATKATGSAAAGQPRARGSRDATFRLAEAVMSFHFASGFDEMKVAIESVHRILLEIEGRLTTVSYHQYLVENDIEPATWRPKVIQIIRDLKYHSGKYTDARAWHAAAKDALAKHLTIPNGQSISQKLKWNAELETLLSAAPMDTAVSKTIHSVKGKEFPAVCVVTTSSLKGILDFLETGEPDDKAEDARKLYVAASRAQKLLVFAAPRSQAARLGTHLRGQAADVEVISI